MLKLSNAECLGIKTIDFIKAINEQKGIENGEEYAKQISFRLGKEIDFNTIFKIVRDLKEILKETPHKNALITYLNGFKVNHKIGGLKGIIWELKNLQEGEVKMNNIVNGDQIVGNNNNQKNQSNFNLITITIGVGLSIVASLIWIFCK